ncbi:MAG: helix-turn-helix domain-containing protein [Betaproteobacteria bacterium]|jgi:DNA-binding XRE family transcriptional regulator|nr:helix-turn-helix domain-containing protein [Betaproteobacteria bacterium]MBK7518451.1 helix-turn-helix domain-containing protein [Betaproteobacteria bacterium]MBK7616261.1 helix-turn-helix domain-containing protein [Burkholderiales bacterium]MBK8104037.1 helix-turn-helix domain-containing protein [Betaproteobacteria bacterium]MBK8865860.1 helix-turn-helix domain-containing protein [Betaproteobacteria bacterium]
MPNIASVLKVEIVRLARKELRSEVDSIRKALAAARAEGAALKRRVSELERSLRQPARVAHARPPSPSPSPVEEADGADKFRFRASGMASNRKRLGLSAADFGLLVGASGQSVYAWEQGKARPRGKNLAAIAALRGVGKREVVERLAALKSGEQP